MWEEWRPSLQQITMSSGESRLAAVHPSLLGVAPSQPVANTAAAAVMVEIPMAMVEAGSEVTLAIPPAPATVEERRETRLPASPGGGTHGSPSWSVLELSRGDVARPEVEHPLVGRGVEIVEIPCSGEAGARVEPLAIPPS